MLARGDFSYLLRNRVSDLVVRVDLDPVEPLRAGIQGSHDDLLLPESMWLSLLIIAVHKDVLPVPPKIVDVFDK